MEFEVAQQEQAALAGILRIISCSDVDAGMRELMERKPDVIVASGSQNSMEAAIAGSQTAPIVMLATAKTLGLEIPSALLARADEVIE